VSTLELLLDDESESTLELLLDDESESTLELLLDDESVSTLELLLDDESVSTPESTLGEESDPCVEPESAFTTELVLLEELFPSAASPFAAFADVTSTPPKVKVATKAKTYP